MKKVIDFTDCNIKDCRHPEHNPPNMIVLSPGVYEHKCPHCGQLQRVIIPLKPRL